MACKQSLDTTLLYYKLSLHPIDVKSILREWHDRLYTNAKTVFWNIQLLCTTTKNFVPSKNLRQMTHEKLYHQLLPNSRLRHEGQSRFHSIYPVHYYRDVHLWLNVAGGEVPRSTFTVKVQCLHDNAVTFADVWSIQRAISSSLMSFKFFLFLWHYPYSQLWTRVNSTDARLNAS